ncbi:MAG: hypothetical protein K2N84_06450, partial [Clostridia bacterium]|nr:hypothetical protein [Clostridia bacterium]
MKNRESKKNKKGLYLKVSLAMLMTACVVTGGVFAAQNFSTRVDDTTVWEQGNAQASSIASTGGYETIDKYYILKAGSMKDDWEAATSDSTLVGKTLHFKLDSDWDLDTGVDALTGVAIPPNPAVSLPAQVRKSLNIPNGYDIILDLNGHKIDRQLASFVNMRIGHVINIEAGAKLTLEDSVGTGVITGGNQGVYSFDQGGGAGGVVNFGTFIMNGGNIRGNMGTWTGGVDSFGTFILNGGRIENNSQGIVFHAAAGVAIYTGDFTMNGGFIGNNAFNANSNAQRMPQLSLWGDAHNGVGGHTYTINGGTIGGSRLFGIKLYGGATLNMYGGEITGCERAPVFMDPVPTEKQANNDNINNPYRGSDVAYLSSKTTFNMYGGSIHDNDTSANSATNDGQIVRIANNEFNMYGGSIKDNKTGSLATIVAKGTSSAKAIINIHGGSIDNNDATGTNGSIISYTDTLYMMDGGTISENTCTGNVIFPVDTNDTFKLYGGSICNNKADYYAIGYGGALTMEVKGAPQVYGNSGGDVLLGAGNAIKIVGRLDTPDGWARIGIKLFTNGSATPNQNKFIIPAGKVYKVTDGFGDYYSDDVPNPNPETVGEKPTVPESDVLPANTFFFADNDPRLTSPKQDLCMKANKAYNNGTTNTYAVTKDAVLANNAGENIYEKWYYEKSTDLGNWHEIEGGTLELTYGDFDVTNVRLVY